MLVQCFSGEGTQEVLQKLLLLITKDVHSAEER